jgi:putative endonuclease
MPEQEWICYLIMSLDSNKTYIGATPNFPARLNKHNSGTGAKYTKGQRWIPILTISGFSSKQSCLSFEKGWQKLSKTRNNTKLLSVYFMSDNQLSYGNDTKLNRIIDLLYFTHHFTYMDNHFKLNHSFKNPFYYPDGLIINTFLEEWICDFPWPCFINFSDS